MTSLYNPISKCFVVSKHGTLCVSVYKYLSLRDAIGQPKFTTDPSGNVVNLSNKKFSIPEIWFRIRVRDNVIVIIISFI